MMLTRRRDWAEQLEALVNARMTAPFAWGSNDCVMWAADVVHALTGIDFAAPYRGTYSTALQAGRLMPEGLEAVVNACRLPRIDPRRAITGDVVLVDIDGRRCLAIVNGAAAVGPGAQGLESVDLRLAVAAWRVGA